jgi:hypothetical protein
MAATATTAMKNVNQLAGPKDPVIFFTKKLTFFTRYRLPISNQSNAFYKKRINILF